ncbi:MAG: hypothetical protein HXX15_17605 [Rhodopseudomonas sp.]|uniref:hypothetical protein n=1 Tax=Rhodopseudomonas sp. TaxID=1078 RepID=UPI0017A62771|nr:hypothetical protein [Rhodopseudomonas sp.]NVN87897.1 hypothetical protein [Rhodopseudomonas sp.]
MPIAFKERQTPRYEGDFEIATSGNLEPPEVALLGRVETTQKAIESGLKKSEELRPSLVAARRKWWSDKAAGLGHVVKDFAGGALDIGDALKAIGDIDVTSEPDISIHVLDSDKAKFDGDFEVVLVSFEPTADEQVYLDNLNRILRSLRQVSEGADRYRALTVQTTLKAYKQGTADQLRKDFASFREGKTNSVDNLLVLKGRYLGLRDRLNNTLFVVSVTTNKLQLKEGDNTRELAVDIDLLVEEGLPPPNDVASPEKQDLYVQISNACTVIRAVCQKLSEQKPRWFERGTSEDAKERADKLLDEYVRKLAGIGTVGLEGSQVGLAQKGLASLKGEFVAREAGRIKNAYVRRLAWWSGGFALAFLAVYIRIRLGDCAGHGGNVANVCKWTSWFDSPWWLDHKTFLLAAVGASIGTWVSFSVRRLDLPFEDLAMQEESSLDPPFRILFVVALTLTACLLFWTGAINIEIGNLKTGPDSFKAAGTVAVLIGMFCGLSERALATAISGRAAAFVRGVAGGG